MCVYLWECENSAQGDMHMHECRSVCMHTHMAQEHSRPHMSSHEVEGDLPVRSN